MIAPADTRREFYTPPEVARRLRCRESKVIAWIRSGRLAAIDISEGSRPRYRISRRALDSFLQARAVAPIARPARRERLSGIPKYV